MYSGRDYINGYNDGYARREKYEHEQAIFMVRQLIKRAIVVAHTSNSYKEFNYSIERAYAFNSAYSVTCITSHEEYKFYSNVIYKIDCKYRNKF